MLPETKRGACVSTVGLVCRREEVVTSPTRLH
jgi:hypothetical protein